MRVSWVSCAYYVAEYLTLAQTLTEKFTEFKFGVLVPCVTIPLLTGSRLCPGYSLPQPSVPQICTTTHYQHQNSGNQNQHALTRSFFSANLVFYQ